MLGQVYTQKIKVIQNCVLATADGVPSNVCVWCVASAYYYVFVQYVRSWSVWGGKQLVEIRAFPENNKEALLSAKGQQCYFKTSMDKSAYKHK